MDRTRNPSEIEFSFQSLLAAGIGLIGLFFVAEGLLATTDNWLLSIAKLLELLGHEAIRTKVLPGVVVLIGHRRIACRLLSVPRMSLETVSKTKVLVRLGAAILGVWLMVIGMSHALGSLLPPVLGSSINQYEQVLFKETATRGIAHVLLGTTLVLSFYFRGASPLVDASD